MSTVRYSFRVAVTGSWFRKVLPDHSLDGELILLGTCKSLKDDRLSEALRAKGAECVVGSDTSIYIPTLCSMTRDFIQELSTRDKDGRFTSATDAINKATAYGIHGSVLIGNLSLAFGHAYRLFGKEFPEPYAKECRCPSPFRARCTRAATRQAWL